MPKEKGGLGNKDIASFNKSLPLKWKQRFITDREALWKRIIERRYSSSSLALAVLSNDEGQRPKIRFDLVEIYPFFGLRYIEIF